MISLTLNLRNPWSNKFKNLWCRSYKTPFKNKFIELECYKSTVLVLINFNWTIRQSHAGLDLEAGIFGYCVHFAFYDCRHWDYDTSQYEVYPDQG